MSTDTPGIPPEVQRQANESAEDLWSSIELVSRSDVDSVQLERIKPIVQQALRTAFERGALISVKEGYKQLQKLAAVARRLSAQKRGPMQ